MVQYLNGKRYQFDKVGRNSDLREEAHNKSLRDNTLPISDFVFLRNRKSRTEYWLLQNNVSRIRVQKMESEAELPMIQMVRLYKKHVIILSNEFFSLPRSRRIGMLVEKTALMEMAIHDTLKVYRNMIPVWRYMNESDYHYEAEDGANLKLSCPWNVMALRIRFKRTSKLRYVLPFFIWKMGYAVGVWYLNKVNKP